MNRNVPLLLISHLCVFAVVAGIVGRKQKGAISSSKAQETRGSTKAGPRDRLATDPRGKRLLKDFLSSRKNSEPDSDSRYRELKASLSVAADVRAAAVEEIKKQARPFFVMPTEQQQAEARALVEVRMLHWMRQDPLGAMDFALEDDSSHSIGLPYDLMKHVYKDLIAERGLAACLPWLIKTNVTTSSFCDAWVAEIKSGGGIATLEKLHSGMMAVPDQAAYFAKISDPGNIWGPRDRPAFLRAAEALPYKEREALLQLANRQEREADQIDLLRGFARSSSQAAGWLLESIQSGEIQGTVAERTRQEAVTAIQKGSAADLDLRVAALALGPGRTGQTRENLATELLGEDISGVLKESRDWRYEFRHGAASAEEVLAAIRTALPATAKAGDISLRKALYRHLVEEEPAQARALIASIPAEEQRELEYNVLQGGFAKASPGVFKDYLATLPAAFTSQEKEQRAKAISGKAAAYAERFGDSYQQSVKAMNSGLDRDAAVEGVIQQARRKNPTQAIKVEQELSPKEP